MIIEIQKNQKKYTYEQMKETVGIFILAELTETDYNRNDRVVNLGKGLIFYVSGDQGIVDPLTFDGNYSYIKTDESITFSF